MKNLILVLFIVITGEVMGEPKANNTRQGKELLRIKIVDNGEEPKISATIFDKPPDHMLRRAYRLPLRRRNFYNAPYTVAQMVNPATRNGAYRTSTVYSPGELTESLGSLVNSILRSRVKYPVSKIYIFSRNNPELPFMEPVYQMYQDKRIPGYPDGVEPHFAPSVHFKPNEIVIRPSIPAEYEPISGSGSGSSPVVPKVTESVEDTKPETVQNYHQNLKNFQKSMKNLSYKPLAMYKTAFVKKPSMMEKIRAYTNFMKRPEYFLPKLEPDHHTESPLKYYVEEISPSIQYEVRHMPSTVTATGPAPKQYLRKESKVPTPSLPFLPTPQPSIQPTQHHAFTTQNVEFTVADAIRAQAMNNGDVSSGEDQMKYRVFGSDSVVSGTSNSNSNSGNNNSFKNVANNVASLSDSGYSTQDAIRLLESKRYSVPRDCSSGCLERNKKNYDPVCGTDGRTYLNEDMLSCLTSCRSTDTDMDYQGPCN